MASNVSVNIGALPNNYLTLTAGDVSDSEAIISTASATLILNPGNSTGVAIGGVPGTTPLLAQSGPMSTGKPVPGMRGHILYSAGTGRTPYWTNVAQGETNEFQYHDATGMLAGSTGLTYDPLTGVVSALATPTDFNHLVRLTDLQKSQIGLQAKGPAVAATTENITLSGLQTIDGVPLPANQRVLVKNQTNQNQNGIYLSSSSVWQRTSDAGTWEDLKNAAVAVLGGTINISTTWLSQLINNGTLDVDPVNFALFIAIPNYTPGAGISLVGNTLSVKVDTTSPQLANTLTNSTAGVAISMNYAGQPSITVVGVVASGTWRADTIDVAHGGTGVSSINGIVKGNGANPFTAANSITLSGSTPIGDFVDLNSPIYGGTY